MQVVFHRKKFFSENRKAEAPSKEDHKDKEGLLRTPRPYVFADLTRVVRA
jgi:hypothetical protein